MARSWSLAPLRRSTSTTLASAGVFVVAPASRPASMGLPRPAARPSTHVEKAPEMTTPSASALSRRPLRRNAEKNVGPLAMPTVYTKRTSPS